MAEEVYDAGGTRSNQSTDIELARRSRAVRLTGALLSLIRSADFSEVDAQILGVARTLREIGSISDEQYRRVEWNHQVAQAMRHVQ